MKQRWSVIVGLILGLTVGVHTQGDLSNQVLQLLARDNTWTGSQTFQNLNLPLVAIPSSTAGRLYADASANLYWNGSLIAGSGSTNNHNLLSSTHADTLAASVVRGDVIVGNSTPAWSRLALCTAGSYLGSDGTDTKCLTSAASFTAIPAANLTGTIAAISGANLTNLNASNLASGTVPLARLDSIANAQIASGAAIAYSKLSLAGSIVLTTDVTGVLPLANGGTGLSTASDDTVMVSSGTAWVAKALTDCNGTTKALNYTASTNAFSCNTISVGSGTVTSVATSVPGILSVSGSPITTSGTLAISLATQSANIVFAGPTSGSAATPTFRALVNADFPTTGVSAGTYPKVTVNTRGFVTAASTSIDLTADVAATILPMANGGTGVAVSADDTFLVGSGSAWVATTLLNGPLAYNTSTNSFSTALPLGAATTSSFGFAGGFTDSTSTTSGTTQNTEYVLNSITLPANAFNANTRSITVHAWGTTAANGNAKNLTIYFGSTAVATVTGSTASGKDYLITAVVNRTGSGTQSGVATIQIDTGVAPALTVITTLGQTDSSSIVISVKSANTAAAAASATGKGLSVLFSN